MNDLSTHTVPALLAMHDHVHHELLMRGVVRTNNVLADYAEYLTARALGVSLVTPAVAGYDALGPNGERVQVKARRRVNQDGRLIGGSAPLTTNPFDTLVGILFDSDFTVRRACIVPLPVLLPLVRMRANGSWRLRLADSLWKVPGVRDATAAYTSIAV